MLANETGMVMTTRKVKIQLLQLAMALAWARQRRGAISAEYKYGPATPVHVRRVTRVSRAGHNTYTPRQKKCCTGRGLQLQPAVGCAYRSRVRWG